MKPFPTSSFFRVAPCSPASPPDPVPCPHPLDPLSPSSPPAVCANASCRPSPFIQTVCSAIFRWKSRSWSRLRLACCLPNRSPSTIPEPSSASFP
ncbi:MAG: hypothetical protein EOM37_20540 [Proteobacteria bacterium]|nr:hypothetical protein [Pseudomonadota bacterium]